MQRKADFNPLRKESDTKTTKDKINAIVVKLMNVSVCRWWKILPLFANSRGENVYDL